MVSAKLSPLSDDVFVWKKKEVEEGTDKLSAEQKEVISKRKEQEKKVELWKVNWAKMTVKNGVGVRSRSLTTHN